MAFGDRMNWRMDFVMAEGAHVPAERVLAAVVYTEQTNLHFVVGGYHSVSYQSTRLERTVVEVGWNTYLCYSCCCFGD